MAAGLYGIAFIVFAASIAVPILKLVVLTYLILAVHFKARTGVKHRVFLYRLTEFVGRWSMVDVFVVMIAETFDPRLLWDARERKQRLVLAPRRFLI